ncbi:hypothetical protein PVL29_020116 [Vitis rotundifolia]|uniref:SS18 N-terminal domain-containing protein n=1 Tax=Vitis rotundifolia TaxID=103349 RepID=A0AA38Z2L3_VITRO|nr:hypothetical protein PVL29_020116 [Vitis rotundifolia]
MQQNPQMIPVMPSFPPTNITTEQIQKYLDENKKLILAILDNQNLGKLAECAQYQAQLQKNLMYLAAIADAQPQAPPTMPPQEQAQQLQQLQQQAMQGQMGMRPGGANGMHPMHPEATLGGGSSGGPPPSAGLSDARGGGKQDSEAGASGGDGQGSSAAGHGGGGDGESPYLKGSEDGK